MSKIIYEKQLGYLSALRSEPDDLIKEMEEFASEKKIPILDWKGAELLEQIVLIHRPKRVLEIGTAIAYSSIRIARHLRKKGVLDTIEKSKDQIAFASQFIERANLNSKINLIDGDALELMPLLKQKYDLIWVRLLYKATTYLTHLELVAARIVHPLSFLWHLPFVYRLLISEKKANNKI